MCEGWGRFGSDIGEEMEKKGKVIVIQFTIFLENVGPTRLGNNLVYSLSRSYSLV